MVGVELLLLLVWSCIRSDVAADLAAACVVACEACSGVADLEGLAFAAGGRQVSLCGLLVLAFLEEAVDVLVEDLETLYFGLDHILEVAFEVLRGSCWASEHVFGFGPISGVDDCLRDRGDLS